MKTRNGFVSNSSSSSFIIAFNPDYNMKDGKRIDEYDDYPFTKFIEMYGQEKCIFNNMDEWIDQQWEIRCDEEKITRKGFMYEIRQTLWPMEKVQKFIPPNWKWARLHVLEDSKSRLYKVIAAMADQSLVNENGDYKGADSSDTNLSKFDFENGYLINVCYIFE